MHLFDEMTEPELAQLFAIAGEIVKELLPDNTAFVILATPFQSQAPWQYVSNADKETMKQAFAELLNRWEEPGHDIPR